MFLVELSYRTVNAEIQDIHHTQQLKETAIEQSKAHLEKDDTLVNRHFDEDRIQTEKLDEEAKDATKRRKALQDDLKKIEDEITQYKNDFNKNLDEVQQLEMHKDFLVPLQEKEFVLSMQENHVTILDQACESWVSEQMDKEEDVFDFYIFEKELKKEK